MAKGRKRKGIIADIAERGRRRRAEHPLEVNLSLRFKFGDEPDEVVTVMDGRRVPMVGSLFDSRDRILRGFTMTLMRAGMSQPKVARELFPVLRLLGRKK
jgi:hypothetical protein